MHCVYALVQSVTSKLESSRTGLNSALSLAVVIPLIDERKQLPALVEQLKELAPEQIIFVDGGSTDGTLEWIEQNAVSDQIHLISSTAGRAKQMNLGASAANQDVLLFLHADTVLPANAKQDICYSSTQEGHWGRFDVTFDDSSLAMNVIAFFMNCRSRLTNVSTGDQAMFIHQQLFDRVGGFDDIALMEDVAMSKKLRSIVKPINSSLKVVTSARRWKTHGVIKTVLTMWAYRFAYFVGVSPDRLAQGYRKVR